MAAASNTGNLEMALQYNDSYAEEIFTFVNNVNTRDGGTHLSGFKSALTRTINSYANQNNLLKNSGVALTGEDAREGLILVLSIKIPEPQFEGQTKGKLGNTDLDLFLAILYFHSTNCLPIHVFSLEYCNNDRKS